MDNKKSTEKKVKTRTRKFNNIAICVVAVFSVISCRQCVVSWCMVASRHAARIWRQGNFRLCYYNTDLMRLCGIIWFIFPHWIIFVSFAEMSCIGCQLTAHKHSSASPNANTLVYACVHTGIRLAAAASFLPNWMCKRACIDSCVVCVERQWQGGHHEEQKHTQIEKRKKKNENNKRKNEWLPWPEPSGVEESNRLKYYIYI